MVYCCRKSEDGVSRSWIPSWWAKASPGNHTSNPYPSHALHWQLIPKYVAITHPQHYCGGFSSWQTNCCLDGEERKQIGGWLVCDLPACIISPPAEVQSRVPWTRSGDLMSFLSMARGSVVGCVPTPALTSPLVGSSVSGCLSCSEMWVYEPVIVVFWQQGLYVKKGKWQCVLTNAAVGSRVSC